MNTVEPRAWGGFLALPENRSALRAVRLLAKAVGAGRRPPFAPLVLHGPPGTGKTHLTTALLGKLSAGGVTARAVAVGDAARFTADDPTSSLADPDLAACDLLVLEDVQLLPPRAADAACDLLDRRLSRRAAVVATANAGPASLGHLPQRFTSRLAGGLVVKLDPPGPASRRTILAAAAGAKRVRLTPDALDWLATQTDGVRPLLGLLNNLAPFAADHPGPLDRPAAAELLAGTGQPTSARRDVPAIVKRVAAAFGVTEKELLGPSRLRRVLVPRQVAMYLCRAVGGLSLPRVGAAFGRDHTTVLHACRKVEAGLEADAALCGRVEALRRDLA